MSSNRYITLICLLLVFGFFLFFRLGALPLFDPDEPRYAQSAREMNDRGSYMVPYFNNEPRLNKPVLYYWLICISYKAFGVSEFSARFGSALAALLLLGTTFFFVSRVRDPVSACLACTILGSSALFFVPARLSMPDMVFSTFMVFSLYCFYLGWQTEEPQKKTYWYTCFYLFQVIAAWTKGPAGILIPCVVALLSILREKDRQEFRRLRLGLGIPLVLCLSLPWYLYIFFFVDSGTMTEMSTHETISRIIGSQGRNFEPLYYYIPPILGGLFPWIFFLPWALSQRVRNKVNNRLRNFTETWFVFVLLFFTLCASKKFQYIICLAPAFALWLSTICADVSRVRDRAKDTGFIVTLAVLLGIALIGGWKGMALIFKKEPSLMAGGVSACCTMLVPLAIALWYAVRKHTTRAVIALSFITLLTLIPFLSTGAEWLGTKRSLKWFLKENEELIQSVDTIYCSMKVFNSLVFYSPKPVHIVPDIETIAEKLKSTEPCLCFISESKYKRFYNDLSPFITVTKYGKVILSNVHTVRAQKPL